MKKSNQQSDQGVMIDNAAFSKWLDSIPRPHHADDLINVNVQVPLTYREWSHLVYAGMLMANADPDLRDWSILELVANVISHAIHDHQVMIDASEVSFCKPVSDEGRAV